MTTIFWSENYAYYFVLGGERTVSPCPWIEKDVDVLIIDHVRVGEGEGEVALDSKSVWQTNGEDCKVVG